MPSAETSLQLSAASLALVKAMLLAHSEISESETGKELFQALDCAWVSAERLRLELIALNEDVVFIDHASTAAPVEQG